MAEDVKSEDLWTPYKNLYRTINHCLCENADNVNPIEFENMLRKHKQNFFALLQNPPKNSKSREELKKGMENGITIKEIGHQILSRDLHDETVILSDMYDLNEFVALDLLCTAQIQMPYYYGLPRGLVAVLLYYEGRKFLVMSLRSLVQARCGVSWAMNVKPELSNFITTYTDQLLKYGLFDKIFDLLRNLDLSKELEKLQENVALGGPRHRRQVIDLFNDIRYVLAEVVFLWSAQSGLPREPTVGLINFLQQLTVEEDAAGRIDNVPFFLLAALLSAMDLTTLQIREDGEEAVRTLPIFTDKDYVATLCAELSPTKPKWNNEGLRGVATFGLAITSACLRSVPQRPEFKPAVDKEVSFLCAAIEMKAFEFINHKILTNDLVYSDEILTRRFHYLFTDFVVHMFAKVKELRIKADETARMMQVYAQEGLEPPENLPRHFENFMQCLARFYAKDPLNLQYCLDFWCPMDGATTLHELYSYRAPPRSVTLFKFIRLAGDLVPATLFVPFLDMLSSLSNCAQAARNCFNMLKQPGAGFNNTLSWDHFFMSFNQYYNNLKQEAPVLTDTVYHRGGVHHKGITPQEIAGLHSVLKLVRTVAERDDFSRLALCEHPGWAPLSVFLGLVSCAVPVPLKADLLLTLAALSKSPETAAQMWNNIEASQILVTVPTTSSYRPRGIQTELDEIESRNEEYPLTRALLTLLDILTDSGIPRMLGAGPRRPGFDPYLTFVMSSVFLKSSTRAYRNPEERWTVCSLCFKLFEKFLDQYEPQPADFPTDGKSESSSPPPGFHLVVQLGLKSEFLNLIVCTLEDGERLFRQHTGFPGREHVEECTLRCLRMLERALGLQATFFDLLSASGSSLILTSLSKLLLAINPRTGRPDHCLNVSKYVCHRQALPRHALAACRILLHVTGSATLHAQYLNILLSNEREGNAIRNGFVEALDAPPHKHDGDAVVATKEVVLRLLKQCLAYGAPNLSHFLFGFDLKRDISHTLFQHPGVLGFPRTCLHSMFTVLEHAGGEGGGRSSGPLLESAYHMLYLLCANHRTSEPVLRFVRQNPKFFERHLGRCTRNANADVAHLNQLSWLMRTVAIELKMSCGRGQISHLQQLTGLLVGAPQERGAPPSNAFSLGGRRGADCADDDDPITRLEDGHEKNLLEKLLADFDFDTAEVLEPRWDYFDGGILANLIKTCEVDAPGSKFIDVRKLHHTLIDEIGSLQASAAVAQRQAILQEIQKVLLHALNINSARNSRAAIVRFVDAWREVVEVLASYLPLEALPAPEQQRLSLSMMESVCRKVTKKAAPPEVGSYLSGAVLLLMENVRKCQAPEQHRTTSDAPVPSVIRTYAESFRVILHEIVVWMLESDAAAQTLRINLYAALNTFLKLVRLENDASVGEEGGTADGSYVSRLDSSKVQQREASYISTGVFSSFGEKLIEVICHDCIGGHDVGKMLAMSTLGMLINLMGNDNWIVYMGGRGYLRHIITGVLNSDGELRALLEPTPQDLKALYLYVSKLSLLVQLATTRVGAELLLEQRLLSCLSGMKVFGSHPEILKRSRLPPKELENFMPPVEARYLQLFLPTLHLCNAILTSLSVENRSAVSQIVYYLASNLDVVEYVLRSGSPALSSDFLEELSCLTSVIARTAGADMGFATRNPESIQDYRSYLHRIQKHMLALLPRFLLTDEVVKSLSCPDDPGSLLYALQIVANLVMYSRDVAADDAGGRSDGRVVFQPRLGDTFVATFGSKGDPGNSDQPPVIGTVVRHLINTVNYYHEAKGLLVKSKPQRELDYCTFIMENCVYLLWSHLDYYMLKAIPKIKYGALSETSVNFNLEETLASASEATWKVSTDDISNLKHGLVPVFNDTFSKRLLETVQDSSTMSQHFVDTLLRKIKRLIQFVPVK